MQMEICLEPGNEFHEEHYLLLRHVVWLKITDVSEESSVNRYQSTWGHTPEHRTEILEGTRYLFSVVISGCALN